MKSKTTTYFTTIWRPDFFYIISHFFHTYFTTLLLDLFHTYFTICHRKRTYFTTESCTYFTKLRKISTPPTFFTLFHTFFTLISQPDLFYHCVCTAANNFSLEFLSRQIFLCVFSLFCFCAYRQFKYLKKLLKIRMKHRNMF